ncbi:hypothetical protein EYF80_038827 [Liparis tanakae]|uniref:Uncharacterized protein n=1 Tax=Liparis tanakae TaxID=230148 RepID=A0A4Z2GE10_9TELE|nr:hypothetical protein EYF80_038827 [Liparis tanakae]
MTKRAQSILANLPTLKLTWVRTLWRQEEQVVMPGERPSTSSERTAGSCKVDLHLVDLLLLHLVELVELVVLV